uniref:WAP domain-containing protein n=1 Tax=Gopherus evgoodei TaxID=1825980 RepID=A0A8C4VWH1_9SAUR
MCRSDRDCPATRKCCSNGCGQLCMAPVLGKVLAGSDAVAPCIAVKPGACPAVLRGSLGPCVEGCHSDSDCSKAEKCCSTGCGHVCKPPKRPGICPTLQRPGLCVEKCSRDAQCPGGQKCCRTGCGRICMGVIPRAPGGARADVQT